MGAQEPRRRGTQSRAADLERLAEARRRALEPRGWHLVVTRGFSLRAPPDFARGWLVGHLPFQDDGTAAREGAPIRVLSRGPVPAAITSFERKGLDRYSEWDLSDVSRVATLDSVWKGSRLELLGREEYRFMGDDNGSTVELTLRRKPVSFASRMGFALFPAMSATRVGTDVELFDQIDREYLSRDPMPERSAPGSRRSRC